MSSRSGSTSRGTFRPARAISAGLPRAAEAGVEAEVDPDVGELLAEEPRLLTALLRQGDGTEESPLIRFSKFRVDSP